MKHLPTLVGRELAAYFLNPMAYLILLAFQVIAWINFGQLITTLANHPAVFSASSNPLNDYLSRSEWFWIALMVALPATTMRLLAEERRSGTLEPLLTMPIPESRVVIAKWLAGVCMYLFILLPFAVYLPFLYYQGKFHFDVGPFFSLAIGMTTIGMMFVAIGLFFSALTKNQIIAAIWTFVIMFVFIFVITFGYAYATTKQWAFADVFQFLSVLAQVQSFGIGQLDLRFLAVHFSVTAMALFMTIKVVQWRRAA
jgi:ABC-2 type transport system permease protein